MSRSPQASDGVARIKLLYGKIEQIFVKMPHRARSTTLSFSFNIFEWLDEERYIMLIWETFCFWKWYLKNLKFEIHSEGIVCLHFDGTICLLEWEVSMKCLFRQWKEYYQFSLKTAKLFLTQICYNQ